MRKSSQVNNHDTESSSGSYQIYGSPGLIVNR